MSHSGCSVYAFRHVRFSGPHVRQWKRPRSATETRHTVAAASEWPAVDALLAAPHMRSHVCAHTSAVMGRLAGCKLKLAMSPCCTTDLGENALHRAVRAPHLTERVRRSGKRERQRWHHACDTSLRAREGVERERQGQVSGRWKCGLLARCSCSNQGPQHTV